MTKKALTSEEIATKLHPVFDEQIINYGAYNLVFASGTSLYRNPDIAAKQSPQQDYFLIGYKQQPASLVVAPLTLPQVTASGAPTSIDNTNALRAYVVNDNTFGIDSTNGTTFIISFEPEMKVKTSVGSGVLDQGLDVEDFEKFLISTWLEPFDEPEDLE